MESQANKKNISYKIFVFSDFDGTIALKDIGNELFKEFGNVQPYLDNFLNKKISVIQYWKSVISALKKDLTKIEIEHFAETYEIDNNFFVFYKFCLDNNIIVNIISDGFDVYLEPFLKKYGISQIPYKSNHLIFRNNNRPPKPVFPYKSESCSCPSALCKRNVILTLCDDDSILIYIGDGISDFCAAEHCDIIFAKNKLAAYCNENNLPHYPFKNFFDIYIILKKLIENKKIKKRHQAKLNRKKAYEVE